MVLSQGQPSLFPMVAKLQELPVTNCQMGSLADRSQASFQQQHHCCQTMASKVQLCLIQMYHSSWLFLIFFSSFTARGFLRKVITPSLPPKNCNYACIKWWQLIPSKLVLKHCHSFLYRMFLK